MKSRRGARNAGFAAMVALAGLGVAFAHGGAARSAAPEPSVLRATYSSFPDYLDPALSYTAEGWTAMYNTYIPLLTYRHAAGEAGSEVIPGLARSLPRITNGGRKYVLYLREGLRYSNGRRVRASDFKYTVRRMFKIFSPGSPFFRDIKRIVTDDESGRIAIQLARSRGTFTYELALPFVALVPAGTPMRDLSAKPPPATGPYAITDSRIGEGWSYQRNAFWETHNGPLLPQLPGGHVDRIEVTVIRNASAQIAALQRGEVDWVQNPPPPDRIAAIRRRYAGTQFRLEPAHSLYYFWMNTRRPPFDDVRIRRAVNYAIDPSALRRIYSGLLASTQQILPPGMPGYRQFELYPHDMSKARRLIAKADPRDRKITVWTSGEAPTLEATAYYARVLRRLGFEAKLKVVDGLSYLFAIGRPSTPKLDTGWSNWFEDYPHPNDFFEPLLAGASVLRNNNLNFSQVDVPALNRRIARLREQPTISEARYAALDRSYMKIAPIAPYGSHLLTTFVSRRVDLGKVVTSPTFGPDLTSFQFE